MYFDPCLAWREKLSADDKETVLTLADVMASAHKGAAESMAASLPAEPRCFNPDAEAFDRPLLRIAGPFARRLRFLRTGRNDIRLVPFVLDGRQPPTQPYST